MKNILVFVAGAFTGIVLFVIAAAFINRSSDSGINMNPGITIFSEPEEIDNNGIFEIFQVINSGNALAFEQEEIYDGEFMSTGMTVLFLAEEGKYYYEDQVIKATNKKCFKQIGIYRYSSKQGERTVPIISLLDK